MSDMLDEGLDEERFGIQPRRTEIAPRLRDQLARLGSRIWRYQPLEEAHAGWRSFAAQRHVRAIAIDAARRCVWLATWGGVLSWEPERRRAIRHTSEHGLPGNAIRCLAVDPVGRVWAGGQNGGLACLNPESGETWQLQSRLDGWRVEQLSSRLQGGVALTASHTPGTAAIIAVDGPGARPEFLARTGLVVRQRRALEAGPDGMVWAGNAWGIHALRPGGAVESYPLADGAGGATPAEVRAIACQADGGVWAATTEGLYFAEPGEPRHWQPVEAAPRYGLLDLALDNEDERLWLATGKSVGFLEDGAWHSGAELTGDRLACLAVLPPSQPDLFDGQVLAGGGQGLYRVSGVGFQPALAYDGEDNLSNDARCIWASASGVWVGAAQGVAYYDGSNWQTASPGVGEAALVDVQAIAPAPRSERLYFAGGRGGLIYREEEAFVTGFVLPGPLRALAVDRDEGRLWIATPDTVYFYDEDTLTWAGARPQVRKALGPHAIQALCWQPASGGQPGSLWVGSSGGLLRFRPALEIWDHPQEWLAPQGAGLAELAAELERLPVQALLFDPASGRLWVGTPDGLYGGPPWRKYGQADVRALALAEAQAGEALPDPPLWVGTASGLEYAGKPLTSANSGLAADQVNALALRRCEKGYELWIATPAGISVALV